MIAISLIIIGTVSALSILAFALISAGANKLKSRCPNCGGEAIEIEDSGNSIIFECKKCGKIFLKDYDNFS